MFTDEIEKILTSDPNVRGNFLGAFPSDSLPFVKMQRNQSLIVNTLRNEEEGVGHWLAFLDRNGRLEYMDPLGRAPRHWNDHIQTVLEAYPYEAVAWAAGKEALQSPGSDCCGEYCVHYIREGCRGRSLEDIINPLRRLSGEERDLWVFNDVHKVPFQVRGASEELRHAIRNQG